MTRHTSSKVGLIALCVCIAGCSIGDPPPFNPESIRRIQMSRVAENRPAEMRPLPTTLQSEFLPPTSESGGKPRLAPALSTATTRPGDPVIRLTLQEVIHRAVANSSDVRVAAYQTGQDAAKVTEAESRFDMTAFANSQFQFQEGTELYTTDPLKPRKQMSAQIQTGLKQPLRTGGQIQLQLQQTYTRQDSSDFFSLSTNPFYTSELTLQLTQPLLQNFGAEINRARIDIARNDHTISTLDFRTKLEEVVVKCEEAYWRLFQAEKNVQIQQDLLDRQIKTAGILRDRWGADVSNVQLSQANADIEAGKTALVRARARVKDISDQLKRFMSDPDLPVAAAVDITPADTPIELPIKYSMADQLETALSNRPEVRQQVLRIDSASVVTKAAKNNMLPSLNIVGSYGIEGRGEDVGDSYRDQGHLEFVNWSVGLQFEVPIGNSGPRAIFARVLLQRQQAIESYRTIVDQVALEVKAAQREVETSWDEMAAARSSRLAAAEASKAIEDRRQGEALTPSFLQLILDRQRAYANAQLTETNAIVSYNIAVSAMEKAKGTLLRYNNITVREEDLSNARQLGGY